MVFNATFDIVTNDIYLGDVNVTTWGILTIKLFDSGDFIIYIAKPEIKKYTLNIQRMLSSSITNLHQSNFFRIRANSPELEHIHFLKYNINAINPWTRKIFLPEKALDKFKAHYEKGKCTSKYLENIVQYLRRIEYECNKVYHVPEKIPKDILKGNLII